MFLSPHMEPSGLTFDWDDCSIDDEEVQKELNFLCEEFGNEYVWYRVSSSKTGLHVMIGELKFDLLGNLILSPIIMPYEEQMIYRERSNLECRGRFFSDSMRKEAGLMTSRIFNIKNGKQVGEWRTFK